MVSQVNATKTITDGRAASVALTDALPPELFPPIFENFSRQELAKIRSVSRQFNKLTQDQGLIDILNKRNPHVIIYYNSPGDIDSWISISTVRPIRTIEFVNMHQVYARHKYYGLNICQIAMTWLDNFRLPISAIQDLVPVSRPAPPADDDIIMEAP